MDGVRHWDDALARRGTTPRDGGTAYRGHSSGEAEYLSWLVQQESRVGVALRWVVVAAIVPLGAAVVLGRWPDGSFWLGWGIFIAAYALCTYLIRSAAAPHNIIGLSLVCSLVDVALASFAIAATGGPRSVFHVLLALVLVRIVTYHPNVQRIVVLSVAALAIYVAALRVSAGGFDFLTDGYFWFQFGLVSFTIPVNFIAIEAVELQKRRALVLTGDLERALDENRRKQQELEAALGELRYVGNEVDRTSTQLASAAEQLSASAQEVNRGVQQLSTTFQQIARGAEVQAEQLADSSHSTQEMSTSISDVAVGAERAAAAAAEARARAEQGGEAAAEATATMLRIKDSMTHSATVIQGLSEKSDQITKIVDTINRFADQTTILALNAAIEAARAGDQGRSFAVIANEIRSLAESSVRSAGQIAALVHAIQREVQAAVGSMGEGTTEIASGVVAMDRAREALNQIIAAVRGAAELAHEISSATSEQRDAGERLARAIAEVTSVAQRNAQAAEQASRTVQQQSAAMRVVSGSAQNLAQMAARLYVLVDKLKG
ncbi:MAG: methyl-accepting chemotaxis protein [Chloroflexi bacterium]|nr:methyl-accepting chemotaxis protein [Chloroflexota bacterium]